MVGPRPDRIGMMAFSERLVRVEIIVFVYKFIGAIASAACMFPTLKRIPLI